MKNKKIKLRHHKKNAAFTLMELLVVIGIIALLVGIMVPGMRAVTLRAKKLKQRAQFHSIEMGLELFKKDFGSYPPSKTIQLQQTSGKFICGAQMLAEALVGRDGRGYEPIQNFKWHEPGETPDPSLNVNELYTNTNESINRRKPRYVEIRDFGIYTMKQLYGDSYAGQLYSDENNGKPAPVVTDIYKLKKIALSQDKTVKVGSPVLYFRANTASKIFKKTPDASDDISTWIYNFYDNLYITGDSESGITAPGAINDPTNPKKQHRLTRTNFYEKITNPNINYDYPYNPKTFILYSAGWDGIFGTRDDVTNFK